jgi:hypothetical protein
MCEDYECEKHKYFMFPVKVMLIQNFCICANNIVDSFFFKIIYMQNMWSKTIDALMNK